MMASCSNSWEPVDWAKAAVGRTIEVEQRRISFFTVKPPTGGSK
jgi:hypothetical protein